MSRRLRLVLFSCFLLKCCTYLCCWAADDFHASILPFLEVSIEMSILTLIDYDFEAKLLSTYTIH